MKQGDLMKEKVCDSCGKKTDRLYVCPVCEAPVCAERCCAGMNTMCFNCENFDDSELEEK